jgi:hypothetical protein
MKYWVTPRLVCCCVQYPLIQNLQGRRESAAAEVRQKEEAERLRAIAESAAKEAARMAEYERQRRIQESDPKYLAKVKNQRLRARYGLDQFIEKESFNRLMGHPIEDRMGASSFVELLDARLDASKEKREQFRESLSKASAAITEENAKKADSRPWKRSTRTERRRSKKIGPI